MQTLFAWWELHWRLWVKQADTVCITLKEVNRSMSTTHATVHCNSNIPHNRERRPWGVIFSVSYTVKSAQTVLLWLFLRSKLATHVTLNQHYFCGLYCFSDLKKNKNAVHHCWKNCWIILFLVLTKTGVLSIFGRLMKCLALQPITAFKTAVFLVKKGGVWCLRWWTSFKEVVQPKLYTPSCLYWCFPNVFPNFWRIVT